MYDSKREAFGPGVWVWLRLHRGRKVCGDLRGSLVQGCGEWVKRTCLLWF